jgi:hypothetical protein
VSLRDWLLEALWFPTECWYFPVIDREAGALLYIARPQHLAVDEAEATPAMAAAWDRVEAGDPAVVIIEPLAAVTRVMALLAFIETLPAEAALAQIAALRRNAWRLDDWRPSAARWLLDLDDDAAARLDAFLAEHHRAAIDALIAEHALDRRAWRVL